MRKMLCDYTARLLIVLFYCCAAVACSKANRGAAPGEQTGVREETSTTNKPRAIAGPRIPPNHCRIIGSIVSIDETLISSDPSNPCSKVPCRATVRIESVLGYGSAFTDPLSRGAEIVVQFTFTLSPTKDLFPDMSREYPGLTAGSRFLSDVEALQMRERGENSSTKYVIYGYEVK